MQRSSGLPRWHAAYAAYAAYAADTPGFFPSAPSLSRKRRRPLRRLRRRLRNGEARLVVREGHAMNGRARRGTAEVLEELLSDAVWRSHYEGCRGRGTEVLVAEAGRFRDALRAMGHAYPRDQVEAALCEMARGERPSAAARSDRAGTTNWNPDRASDIRRRTLRDFAEHARGVPYAAVDTAGLEETFNEMADAEAIRNPRAYLDAARRTVLAGRRAAREARARLENGNRPADESLGEKWKEDV